MKDATRDCSWEETGGGFLGSLDVGFITSHQAVHLVLSVFLRVIRGVRNACKAPNKHLTWETCLVTVIVVAKLSFHGFMVARGVPCGDGRWGSPGGWKQSRACVHSLQHILSALRGAVMAHFLSEGHCPGGSGWLAVDERGQGGVSIPAPIAQGIDSSPCCSSQPPHHNGNSLPFPHPHPRRAAETQPDWIQDSWEPVPHRKFPGASFCG